jgi:hypothetical protein
VSFEYIALAGSAGVFLLVLAGVGLAVLLRVLRRPGPPSAPPSSPAASAGAPSPSPVATVARTLLDAIHEIQKDAAAGEMIKALADPANNPHIPSFLAAKPAAPAGKPEGEGPK